MSVFSKTYCLQWKFQPLACRCFFVWHPGGRVWTSSLRWRHRETSWKLWTAGSDRHGEIPWEGDQFECTSARTARSLLAFPVFQFEQSKLWGRFAQTNSYFPVVSCLFPDHIRDTSYCSEILMNFWAILTNRYFRFTERTESWLCTTIWTDLTDFSPKQAGASGYR